MLKLHIVVYTRVCAFCRLWNTSNICWCRCMTCVFAARKQFHFEINFFKVYIKEDISHERRKGNCHAFVVFLFSQIQRNHVSNQIWVWSRCEHLLTRGAPLPGRICHWGHQSMYTTNILDLMGAINFYLSHILFFS